MFGRKWAEEVLKMSLKTTEVYFGVVLLHTLLFVLLASFFSPYTNLLEPQGNFIGTEVGLSFHPPIFDTRLGLS